MTTITVITIELITTTATTTYNNNNNNKSLFTLSKIRCKTK